MRSCLVIFTLVTCLGFSANAFAQAPTTLAELRAVLIKSAETAKEITSTREQIAEANQRAKALIEEKRQHDSNRCTFPPGHPEKCAQYNADAAAIDKRVTELLNEFAKYEEEMRTLKANFHLLMARIRIARLLNEVQKWYEIDVLPCTAIQDPIAAQVCLGQAWERHP
jgi:chromosome segregation ATPase